MSQRNARSAGRLSAARLAAYEALERIDARGAFAQDAVAAVIDGSPMGEADRAFATRLVLGVVSMGGAVDAVLDRCLRSPRDVRANVRRALRVPTYEIVWLGKSPHAAVDQGVELVRAVEPKAAGLANAVLRKVAKAAQEFPFGDAGRDLAAFSLQQGFPLWLVEKLAADLGEGEARAFAEASNEPAPLFLFANPAREGAGEACTFLADAAGAEPVPEACGVPLSGCMRVADRRALADPAVLALFEEGRVIASDASAQAVAALCVLAASGCARAVDDVAELAGASCAEGPASVLELCSGRGTKTVMLQGGLLRSCGRQASRYVAVDNVAFKRDLLVRRAAQCGVSVSEALCMDVGGAGQGVIAQGGFGLVFLDAPCTGLGTLRRHQDIRWRVSPEAVAQAAEVDAALLRAAAGNVAPGGFLAYATCTVTDEENRGAVEAFLASDAGAGFRPVGAFGRRFFQPRLAPGGPDAHFCALMQRT